MVPDKNIPDNSFLIIFSSFLKKYFCLPPHVFPVIWKKSMCSFRFRDSLRKIKTNIQREFVQNGIQAYEKNSGWRK